MSAKRSRIRVLPLLLWLIVVLVAVLLCGPFVRITGDYVHCDLNSGRIRHMWRVCGVPVQSEITETEFSRMAAAVSAIRSPPEWAFCNADFGGLLCRVRACGAPGKDADSAFYELVEKLDALERAAGPIPVADKKQYVTRTMEAVRRDRPVHPTQALDALWQELDQRLQEAKGTRSTSPPGPASP